jgi:hypothetical protein
MFKLALINIISNLTKKDNKIKTEEELERIMKEYFVTEKDKREKED